MALVSSLWSTNATTCLGNTLGTGNQIGAWHRMPKSRGSRNSEK